MAVVCQLLIQGSVWREIAVYLYYLLRPFEEWWQVAHKRQGNFWRITFGNSEPFLHGEILTEADDCRSSWRAGLCAPHVTWPPEVSINNGICHPGKLTALWCPFHYSPWGGVSPFLFYFVLKHPGQELRMAAVWGEGGSCFLHPKSEGRVWEAVMIWRNEKLLVLIPLKLAKTRKWG